MDFAFLATAMAIGISLSLLFMNVFVDKDLLFDFTVNASGTSYPNIGGILATELWILGLLIPFVTFGIAMAMLDEMHADSPSDTEEADNND